MTGMKFRVIGSWLALGLLSSPCVSAGAVNGGLALPLNDSE